VGEESARFRRAAAVTKIVTILATASVVFSLWLPGGRREPGRIFIFAMGMIVACVPEGMLPDSYPIPAMGVQRMAGRNFDQKTVCS